MCYADTQRLRLLRHFISRPTPCRITSRPFLRKSGCAAAVNWSGSSLPSTTSRISQQVATWTGMAGSPPDEQGTPSETAKYGCLRKNRTERHGQVEWHAFVKTAGAHSHSPLSCWAWGAIPPSALMPPAQAPSTAGPGDFAPRGPNALREQGD